MKGVRELSFVLVAVLLIASCRVVKPYESPLISTDSLYRVETADTNTMASIPWEELFTDPRLQDLIRLGLENNPDLQTAFERIQQSRSYYLQSSAAYAPDLNANVGVGANRYSDAQNPNKNTGMQYQLGVSSSWELDIWGRLSSSKRAAFANLLQSEAGARSIQTAIISGIASYYYALLALDAQLNITRETVKNWDLTVETMKALKISARVTEAAVVQSEAQRYAAEVTIPDLQQNISETENALSILLGAAPGPVIRGELADQAFTEMLNVGVPAQLLRYRPDVQQAEYAYRSAFEMTNVARTYFYPSLSITGSASFSSGTLDKLLNPGAFAANVAGGLLQPVFNRRANKTRLEVAESQQQEALLNFRGVLLNAGREVSDALSLYETANQKISIRANQLSALEKSVEYSQELLQNGFATYTEIITARQSLLQAELGRVNDRLQQLRAVVNLYSALGGGTE